MGGKEMAQQWVALQDVGKDQGFFDSYGRRNADPSKVVVGDILRANRDVHVRKAPADWRDAASILKTGRVIKVLELKIFRFSDGRTQTWAQIAILGPQIPTYRQVLSFVVFGNENAAKAKDIVIIALTKAAILDQAYNDQQLGQLFPHSKEEDIFEAISRAYDHLKDDLYHAPGDQEAGGQDLPEQLDPAIEDDHQFSEDDLKSMQQDLDRLEPPHEQNPGDDRGGEGGDGGGGEGQGGEGQGVGLGGEGQGVGQGGEGQGGGGEGGGGEGGGGEGGGGEGGGGEGGGGEGGGGEGGGEGGGGGGGGEDRGGGGGFE
jgi:hypothetical protein